MSFETVRISELAKELGLSSKEVIEKFAQISVTGKTHSSTVTLDQIKKLKEFIASGGVKKVSKPKAFVVKKAKAPEVVVEKQEPKKDNEKPATETKKRQEPPLHRTQVLRAWRLLLRIFLTPLVGTQGGRYGKKQ